MTQRRAGPPPDVPDCEAIERVLSILGRAWAGAVLTALRAGRCRYTDLRHTIAGVSDSTLTARLKELCAAGLVVRLVDAGVPVTVSYELTEAGRDIAPVLDALAAYARAHPDLGLSDQIRSTEPARPASGDGRS